MEDTQPDRMIGRLLDGKYRIVRRVGEGGMGSVYEAEHIRINRKVAIKVMHESHTDKPGAVERFIREAEAASAIGHPNIIEIEDIVQETDGTTALVMELLNGHSLEDILKKKGRLPPARAVSIILQMLSALHYAHQKGILHRDLKPDNVFIAVNARGQEEVKLLDFGIAKFLEEKKETGLGLTKTGTVLGTPYYLAPEQAKGGKDIDARIDIWSAGVMLYETLSGSIPFGGDNYNEILGNILLEQPIALNTLVPSVPSGLAEVVHKALAKDKANRFQSVAAMIGTLLPFMDQNAGALSEPVARALKESVDPPPFRLHSDKKVVFDDKTELLTQSELVSQNATTNAIAVNAALPGSVNTSRKRVRLFTAVLAVLLLAVGLGLILTFDGQRNQEPLPEGSPLVAMSRTTGEADSSAITPAPKVLEMVTIQFHGLPHDAEVVLDDKVHLPPLVLERSDGTKKLQINAPGYRSFRRELIPDADKTLDVAMKKKRKRGRRSSIASRAKQQPSKTQEKRGEVWTRNPFAK